MYRCNMYVCNEPCWEINLSCNRWPWLMKYAERERAQYAYIGWIDSWKHQGWAMREASSHNLSHVTASLALAPACGHIAMLSQSGHKPNWPTRSDEQEFLVRRCSFLAQPLVLLNALAGCWGRSFYRDLSQRSPLADLFETSFPPPVVGATRWWDENYVLGKSLHSTTSHSQAATGGILLPLLRYVGWWYLVIHVYIGIIFNDTCVYIYIHTETYIYIYIGRYWIIVIHDSINPCIDQVIWGISKNGATPKMFMIFQGTEKS